MSKLYVRSSVQPPPDVVYESLKVLHYVLRSLGGVFLDDLNPSHD